MKSVVWFIAGIAAGFVVAHQVAKTEQGGRLFAEIDGKARDFGRAVSDGYRAREAQLREAIDAAGEAITDPAL